MIFHTVFNNDQQGLCCAVCWLQSRFYCCWIFYGFYVVFISLQRLILHCSEAPELVNITA